MLERKGERWQRHGRRLERLGHPRAGTRGEREGRRLERRGEI
jgi:hypothetical protein